MSEPRVVRLLSLLAAVLAFSAFVAIDPFGSGRAEIFVEPKLRYWALATIPVLLIILVDVRTAAASRAKRNNWLLLGLSATLALTITLSASNSANPFVAWLGYPTFPEGGAFYLGLIAWSILLAQASSASPSLARTLLAAALIAGTFASILAIPQKYDWRVDYTATSGQTVPQSPQRTIADVWRGQSPNSVYWHRGHLGIVAGVVLVTAVAVALRSRSSSIRVSALLLVAIMFCAIGVVISDTRTPQLAAAVGLSSIWMTRRIYREANAEHTTLSKQHIHPWTAVLIGVVVGLAISSTAGGARDLSLAGALAGKAELSELVTNTSSRTRLWGVALNGWLEKPLLGHGFLSFHNFLAEDQVADAVRTGVISATEAASVRVGENGVSVERANGTLWQQFLVGSKPHNQVLEYLLSIGAVGTLCWLMILGVLARTAIQDRNTLLVAVLMTWATYLVFWYESAQYSPLVWSIIATQVTRGGRQRGISSGV